MKWCSLPGAIARLHYERKQASPATRAAVYRESRPEQRARIIYDCKQLHVASHQSAVASKRKPGSNHYVLWPIPVLQNHDIQQFKCPLCLGSNGMDSSSPKRHQSATLVNDINQSTERRSHLILSSEPSLSFIFPIVYFGVLSRSM